MPLPLKPMPTVEELEAQLAVTEDRAIAERLFRKIQILRNLSGGEHEVFPAWVWRVGDSLVVAQANEAYSCFQEDLRRAFPETTVVVMNTSGAEMGYLYPPELDGQDIYQVWQTPFGREALPTLTEHCIAEGERLFAGDRRRRAQRTTPPRRAPVGAPSRQAGGPRPRRRRRRPATGAGSA